jgi:hypothetical protein
MPLVNVMVNGRAYTGSIGQASAAKPSAVRPKKNEVAPCLS